MRGGRDGCGGGDVRSPGHDHVSDPRANPALGDADLPGENGTVERQGARHRPQIVEVLHAAVHHPERDECVEFQGT